MDKKILEVKQLAQDAQKSKHYLLNIIKRLEEFEQKIDGIMVAKNKVNKEKEAGKK